MNQNFIKREFNMRDMDPAEFITRKEAAALLGLRVSTLAVWAMRKVHIPFIKVGRLVRYLKRDIMDFKDRLTFNASYKRAHVLSREEKSYYIMPTNI